MFSEGNEPLFKASLKAEESGKTVFPVDGIGYLAGGHSTVPPHQYIDHSFF